MSRNLLRATLRAAVLAFGCLPTATQAQEYVAITGAAIIPGWQTRDGTRMAALHLVLAEGWKTYWRAPGDNGIPPRFDWSGSQNIQSVVFHWPRPGIFDANGVRTIGFKDVLVLPLEFTLQNPNAPVHISTRIDLGVCEEVCIPMTLDLTATIAPSARTDVNIIEAALAQRPHSAARAGGGTVTCRAAPIADGLSLSTQIPLPRNGNDPEVVIFELPDDQIWISPADTHREGGQLHASAEMVPPEAAPFAFDRAGLRVTVISPTRSVEFQGCRG